jgi:hypothetical protein
MAGLVIFGLLQTVQAQPPGFGGRGGGGPPASARDAAPVDLTGTWVSLVTEDWIERMSPDSPASGTGGGFGFGRGRGAADAGTQITSDDPCAAYGAGAIMRVPGRVKIRWEDDSTLLFEYDAGSQRRIIHFSDDAPAQADTSLQGWSTASWQAGAGGGNRGRGGPPASLQSGAAARWGSLKIVTTDLSPGYLITSRSWYGVNAMLTELIRIHSDFGQPYFTVTAIIEENGTVTSTTSSTFKKESGASGFDAGKCEITPR